MTLIEVLVVMAVITLLITLITPAFTQFRAKSRGAQSLSNVHQIGLVLDTYSSSARDLPPTFFTPDGGFYPADQPQHVDLYGREVSAFWFDHSAYYHYAFSPALPASVLLAPGSTRFERIAVDNVMSVAYPDYLIPECLYADPTYWNERTQLGKSQWAAQRLSRIAFPSQKGLVFQVIAYGEPGFAQAQYIPSWPGTYGSVMWADHSATSVRWSDLNPGVRNLHGHYTRTGDAPMLPAIPISQTRDGVLGRDR